MTAAHAIASVEARDTAPDAVNWLVDLAEQAIRSVVDCGGEAALRARIERLLPAPAQAPESLLGASGADKAPAPDEMDLVQVLAALRIFDSRRLNDAESQAKARAKEIVGRWLDAAKQGRGQ